MSKGTPFVLPKQVAYQGGTLSGAKLTFSQTGTDTELAVYTTAALSAAHTQPIAADSNGLFAAIYLNPDAAVDYRVKLTESDDTLVYQLDTIQRYWENFDTGSFTVTWEGFSADPGSTSASWFRIGRLVMLTLPVGLGTSDSTSFGASGLPTAIRPDSVQYVHFPYCQDSGSHLAGGCVAEISVNGTIDFAPADAAYSESGWTAASDKGLETIGDCMYRLKDD